MINDGSLVLSFQLCTEANPGKEVLLEFCAS